MTVDSASGALLTKLDGMTLYTFDKDTAGVFNCAGALRRRARAAKLFEVFVDVGHVGLCRCQTPRLLPHSRT